MNLTTKRKTLAQVVVCFGCCCGRTDKGKPEVPLDWLKAEWKSRKLLKQIQLSISGCVGPCDVANVVTVVTPQQTIWLGSITERRQYETLLEWASLSAAADRLLPLPPALQTQIFERWREESDALEINFNFEPLAQKA